MAAPLRVFLLDAAGLQANRERLRAGDTNLVSALAQLREDADAALKAGPFSVVNKEQTPPSGDKHDYLSQGPYWWPNPDTTNGLPYIRRDGETNPEIDKISDHRNLGRMASAVETLALAWYFTGEERYAAGAARLLRAWFLEAATRMNPNLQFGQGIPGITTGRGIGLIETRRLAGLVDGVGLLAGSKSWTDADQRGLEEWFRQFVQWMTESQYGRDEAAAKNNHGTYYDVQVASFALLIGNRDLARKVLQEAGPKRIATQIEPDGRQPHELARTRSWGYSTMNLSGLMSLARLGEHVGVDLWHYETPDGRSLRKALDYLVPFGFDEQPWPFRQISGRAGGGLASALRQAAVKYPDGPYRDLLPKARRTRDAAGRNSLLHGELADAPQSAGSEAVPPPRVFLFDAKRLAAVKVRILSGDLTTNEVAALAQLKRDATEALAVGPFSVVNKDFTPPSGDKHEYMSMGPYWWPNPATSNGLPYIRRDGQRNPEIYKIPNRIHLGQLTDAVETLAVAHYFAGDETFAARAALLLRTWFLDPATRMNPHLEYGQAVPGHNTGRGIGIIETRALTRIVDSLGLLAGSRAWTRADQEGMEQWFGYYLTWMLESPHGRDEAAAENNHGTYYDVQVASYAFFLGKSNVAAQVLREVGPKRIAVQVAPDGGQPLELERTRAWSYSVGNLAGLMALAQLGEHIGLDLWRYESPDGRSLRKALDFLLPYGLGEKWPRQQIDGLGSDLFHPVLRLAAVKLPQGPYGESLSKIPALAPGNRSHLILSPLEPVNRLHLPREQSE